MTAGDADTDPNRPVDRGRRLLLVVGPAAVWTIQPFTSGSLIGDALDPTRQGFRSAATLMAWVVWVMVLVLLVVPRPVTLTAARIASAALFPVTVWAATEVDVGAATFLGILASAVAAVVPMLPAVGERFVDGVSYGDERRYPLRPPGPVLLVLLLPTWALTVAGAVTGPLLLADGRWVSGGIALAIGIAAVLAGFRSLNRLTTRFLVFVPNGIVLHDMNAVAEPVLIRQHEIAAFGPARADSGALDISAGAPGMALELRFHDPIAMPIITGRAEAEDTEVRALLVVPTRPANVLGTAARRGITVA